VNIALHHTNAIGCQDQVAIGRGCQYGVVGYPDIAQHRSGGKNLVKVEIYFVESCAERVTGAVVCGSTYVDGVLWHVLDSPFLLFMAKC
jgi:hypothetical protein